MTYIINCTLHEGYSSIDIELCNEFSSYIIVIEFIVISCFCFGLYKLSCKVCHFRICLCDC